MKEPYYQSAQAEYIKMLGRFSRVQVTELADEPLHRVKGQAQQTAALAAEARRVLPHLKDCRYIIACDVKGIKLTSESFAQHMGKLERRGVGTLCIVIGGSLGLAPEVLKKAHLRLSFSDMTMPHRLFRIVLLEQLFRAYKILNNETYHK